MSAGGEKYLRIYIGDHLALLTGEIELAKRAHKSNKGTDLGRLLAAHVQFLAEERKIVERLARSKRASASAKRAALWGAEKVGRLKLNGRLSSYSPLSRVLEIEGLLLAAEARERFWQSIHEAGAAEGLDATARASEAQAQIAELKRFHLQSARTAFVQH